MLSAHWSCPMRSLPGLRSRRATERYRNTLGFIAQFNWSSCLNSLAVPRLQHENNTPEPGYPSTSFKTTALSFVASAVGRCPIGGPPMLLDLTMWGIIPAAGAGRRIQPLALSNERLPVGGRLDGTVERPRAISEYLVDRMVVAGADKLCWVIAPG